MKTLVELALAITMMAIAAGNLPKIVRAARKAQAVLIMESRSSQWGTPWTPP